MKLKDLKMGSWLSAAQEDPKVCKEMKDDINEYFEYFNHDLTKYGSLLSFFKPVVLNSKEELEAKFKELDLELFEGSSDFLKLKHISATMCDDGYRLFYYKCEDFSERERRIEHFKKANGEENVFL